MKQLVLSFITLFMIGCGSSGIDLKPNEKLSTHSYSIVITGNGWWTGQKVEDRMLKFQGMYDRLWFSRHLPNMMSEDVSITVSIIPQDEIASDYLLYKNQGNQMEERIKNFKMSDWEKRNNAERGVNYVKQYVDYIGGLKCGTRVESSNIALGVGTKSYQTNCTYFDNQGGAKNIHFGYSYTYTHSGTKYDGDSQSSSVSPETMQLQFKKDMKAIFDSLVIHDMDRERMRKEGLLHDKKYDINSEFR